MNTTIENPAIAINFLDVGIGVVRQFGELDIGAAGLASGWALPESGHTWNDGNEAVLECSIPILNHGCWVEFTGAPFFCEGTPHQDVYFYINGFRLEPDLKFG